MTTFIDHVAVEVGDFDDRLRVLTDRLGFTLCRIGRLSADPDRRIAMVSDPRGVKVELVEGVAGAPDRLAHLALDVGHPDRVDEFYDRMLAAGAAETTSPRRLEPAKSRTATARIGAGADLQFVAYDDDSPDRPAGGSPSQPDTAAVPWMDELVGVVGADRVSVDADARRDGSRDYAWLSPILRDDLPERIADAIVSPTLAQLPAVLDVAHRHRVPVTPRGRGTGNYGQAVPLRGGLVVDLSTCATIRSIDDGVADVEAGVTFTALERAANEVGLEAAVMPSMLSSTVGGFLSGGNQGIGSIAHGSIWDGWVRELDVLGCGPGARPFTVVGDDVNRYLHTYGTAGLITGARLALAPAHDRVVVFAAFEEFVDAATAGRSLMDLDPAPRALSVDDAALGGVLPAHPGVIDGAAMVRAAVAVESVEAATGILEAAGGTVSAVDADAMPALFGSVYNHATLRAYRSDPDVCALQVRGWAIIEHYDAVRQVLPDVRLHLDGNAPAVHGRGYSGLLLSRWVDRATLAAGISALRALGVRVISPHSWTLGGHGDLDDIRRLAAQVDPDGLLNPGKLPVPT